MITDSTKSHLSPAEVLDRLKTVMAAEHFEILESSSNEIRFRHGAYFSSTAPSFPKRGQFPKRGRILIQPNVNGTQIELLDPTTSGPARFRHFDSTLPRVGDFTHVGEQA